MEQSFDEVELVRLPDERPEPHLPAQPPPAVPVAEPLTPRTAPIINRALAFLTDVSLFGAVALAMSPLLPLRASLIETARHEPLPVLALSGFLLLVSMYFCVLSWMIWGRTIGGSLFDLRIAADDGGPVDGKRAIRRWAGTLLGVLTLGAGFLPALMGERRSVADRLSSTQVRRNETE